MAGLCEGGNEPSGSLKAISGWPEVERMQRQATLRTDEGIQMFMVKRYMHGEENMRSYERQEMTNPIGFQSI
ncbi:hypothetical protein ANN_10610 [Periplaneta americana]|uniref:Uncharacterized protein n=1 Tax=Periplaneta americana TaxID=6978 RepID=A0ABQ8TRS9_PERAM|nr:hypothetical protein ANN_10610 [Periplaneta americana]